MDDGIKLSVNKPDGLEPVLTIDRAVRGHDHMVVAQKHAHPERQLQPVLETVGFVLGRIELELHCL